MRRAVAGAIPDHWKRSELLTAIIRRLTSADPKDPALIERARTIPDDREASWPLAAAAVQLAAADPTRTAALLDQALTTAETIPLRLGAQRSVRSNPCSDQEQHAG